MELTATYIDLCKKHDRRALGQLYEYLYAPLMSMCHRYNHRGHEGSALFNQAFLRVLESLDKKKESAPFLAWSRRIMMNILIDEFRKTRREKITYDYPDLNENMEQISLATLNEIEDVVSQEFLLEMVNQLPELTAKVFNMFAIDHFEHKEIAEMLGITLSNSKWHVFSARAKLGKALNQYLNQKNKVSNG